MTERMVTIPEFEFERIVMLLDSCLDALDDAAAREARREAGKKLRCITHQSRAEAVRETVKAAAKHIHTRHASLWFEEE